MNSVLKKDWIQKGFTLRYHLCWILFLCWHLPAVRTFFLKQALLSINIQLPNSSSLLTLLPLTNKVLWVYADSLTKLRSSSCCAPSHTSLGKHSIYAFMLLSLKDMQCGQMKTSHLEKFLKIRHMGDKERSQANSTFISVFGRSNELLY